MLYPKLILNFLINKNMSSKILMLALLSFLTFSAKSQLSYENRIEFELKDGYSDEKIIEFGSEGFIMTSKESKSRGTKTTWKYDHYDSDLELINSEMVVLNSKFRSDETFTTDDHLHTLYKDRKGNFSIVSVQVYDLHITQVNGALPKRTYVSEMAVLGDFVFLKAFAKKHSFLLSINWKTGERKFNPVSIPNIRDKNISLLQFQTRNDPDEVIVYAKAKTGKNENDIYVIHMNGLGEKQETVNLTEDIDQNIIDISSTKLSDHRYIYTGTYSTNSLSSSEGLFFCQAADGEMQFISFYNFLDLDNFLSYLPKRKVQKIEKKKNKKKAKGKELKLNYHIAAHDIIPIEDGYLFLGEAYYPTYRTETYTTTTYSNGTPITTTRTRTVFDGYRYTHAILGKFDEEGDLLWDEVFEMWPSYKPFYVKKFISVAEKNPYSLKLVFANRNKIVSKSIGYTGVVLSDSQSDEIKTNYDGDESRSTFSNIDFWYEDYFIAYGKQKIKNKKGSKETKRKRKVYFVSKLKYE